MGVAALAATFLVWSIALNPLVKRKLKLSLFLLIGYVLLHVVFTIRPELGGAAATDAASPIRPFERLADFPMVAQASPELRLKVKEKFSDLLARIGCA